MKPFIEKIKYQTILVSVGLLVFGVVLTYGHISIDDPAYVFDNPFLKHLVWGNVLKFLFQPYANMVRPVDSLVYLLEYKLWGMSAAGYHLTNLLFHITNSILVFTLLGFFMKERFYRFLAALVFLLHPVQAETVAWISEQKSTLSTLFLLIAVLSYIKFRREQWSTGKWVSLLCFLSGMLVKPNIVVFPVLLVWYDFIYTGQPLVKNIAEKYYFWILSLLVGMVYLFFVHKTGFTTSLFGGTLSSHILTTITNIAGIAQYPLALLFPFYIHMIAYPDHPIIRVLSSQFLLSIFFLIIVFYSVYYTYQHKHHTVLFFIGWYYINFFLASGIIPIAYQGAVRYLYIPVIGPAVLFAMGMKWLYDNTVNTRGPGIPVPLSAGSTAAGGRGDDDRTPHRAGNPGNKIMKYTVILSVTLVLCSFIAIDLVSVGAWRNELAFWKYQVWSQPDNGRDRAFLADTLVAGRYADPAIEQARKAVLLSPDDPVVWSKVFTVYYLTGMYDTALQTLDTFHSVLIRNYGELDPVLTPDSGAGYDVRNYYFLLYSSYADVYFKTSRYDAAVMYGRKALALQPENEHVFALAADSLLLVHKPEEALDISHTFIDLQPDSSTGYLMTALAYEQSGRLNDAISNMDKAITLCKDKLRRDFMVQKRQKMYNLLMQR